MKPVFFGLLGLVLSSCAGAGIDVMPRYGQLNSSGKIGASNSGTVSKTELSDLGLDGDDSVPGVRVDADLLVAHVVVSGLQMSDAGNGQLTGDFSHGGNTIPAGTAVHSSLDFDTLSLYGTFDFLPTDMFELGLGLGVTGMHVKGNVRSTQVVLPEVDIDEDAVLPVLVAIGAVNVGPFGASALLAGTQINYSGDDVTYSDVDLNAYWQFIDTVVNARLSVGWRRIAADAEFKSGSDNVQVDAVFDGPYLGLSIGF
jgi:hypothetical protein